MAVGCCHAILAAASAAPSAGDNGIIVVCSIIGAAGIITAGIWRLVKATYTIAQTTKDNSANILDLTANIKGLREEMGQRITVGQHDELLNRVRALEAAVMRHGDDNNP